MTKFFKKPNQKNLILSRTFYKFLLTCKKSEKPLYVSDNAAHSQTARQRDDRTDRKWEFHRTTTLHAAPCYKPAHFTEPPHHITL